MIGVRHRALAALLLPTVAMAQDLPPHPLNPLATLDEATMKAFVERPLFEPLRRPPIPAAPLAIQLPPPAPVVEHPPMLRLIGIVEGSHSLSAIVHRDDTNATETLRSGDRIGSWTIEVMPGALRAVNGDRAFDYAIFPSHPQEGPKLVATVPGAEGAR